jgi:hypothetical protein
MYLVLYVDDFLMSGPEENMEKAWAEIAEVINIEDPGPMGLYLGCVHEEGTVEMDDGRKVRTMTFNQESFFSDKIDKYIKVCQDKGGITPSLANVSTPFLKDSPKENTARRPEKEGEPALMCKWCRHAFAESDAKIVQEK